MEQSAVPQLYLLYVVDWNKDREWNGGDIVINDVFTREQLLRWVFNFDMLHRSWGSDGICYYASNASNVSDVSGSLSPLSADTFDRATKALGLHIDKYSQDIQDSVFDAYVAAFDPSSVFVDRSADCTDWSDFCGNQSYCGYLRRLNI